MARVRQGMRTYAENKRRKLEESESSNRRSTPSSNGSGKDASLAILVARIDKIASEIEALQAENSELCEHVASLESKIKALEQENMQLNVTITKLGKKL